MIIEYVIAMCTASAVAPLGSYILYQNREVISRKLGKLFGTKKLIDCLDENQTHLIELAEDGIILEKVPDIFSYDEEYSLSLLEKIHPDASKEYDRRAKMARINHEADSVVYTTLMQMREGRVEVAGKDKYNMVFSNGLSVWTENRYFAFGHLTKNDDNHRFNTVRFNWEYERYSKFTFMWLVDVYLEHYENEVWRGRRAMYSHDDIQEQEPSEKLRFKNAITW